MSQRIDSEPPPAQPPELLGCGWAGGEPIDAPGGIVPGGLEFEEPPVHVPPLIMSA